MKRIVLLLALAAAIAVPAVASETDQEATSRSVPAVVLRLHVGDRPAEVKAPIGSPVRIEDVDTGVRMELVPMLDAAGGGGDVVVEIYGPVGGKMNLVESLLLPAAGAVSASHAHLPLRIELVGFEQVELGARPAALDPETGELRPRWCCITCDGLTVCSDFCVSHSCGSCCTN